MSVRDRYEAISKRTFKSALIQLLEREYKVLGSHKVLAMLADDIDSLYREFYPDGMRFGSGTLCWNTTADDGQRQSYGKRAEEYGIKTVFLPYITEEDIEARMVHKRGVRNDNYERGDQRDIRVMERLLRSAYEQGGLLSIGELSAIMNRSLSTIGKYIKKYYLDHPDKTLPLKGYLLDQGSNPTHKGLICSLYERGLLEADIVRQTGHSASSVGKYIKTYKRVLALLRKGFDFGEIIKVIGQGERTLSQYVKIAYHFHPELQEKKNVLEEKQQPPSPNTCIPKG